MPKISVLMPVYNTDPHHLKQAIDSVLNQTFDDFEFIIVNDASTKAHVNYVVQSYTDPRIVYIQNNLNMGISAARNMMLDLAKGEYIAVMDHDDMCLPTRFEKQTHFMDMNRDHVLCGTAYRRFGSLFKKNVIRYPTDSNAIKATLFFKSVVHHPSAMIRKQAIADHNIRYDETLVSSNDRKLYLDLSMHGKIHNLHEVLCLYRIHSGMTSKIKRQIIVQDQKRLRAEFLNKMGLSMSVGDEDILDQYIVKGRSRIKDKEILVSIQNILEGMVKSNNKTSYFPPVDFAQVCASYFVKRCTNAAFYGRVPSGFLLKNTALPMQSVKVPIILRIFNSLARI